MHGRRRTVNFGLQREVNGAWVTYQVLPQCNRARNVRADFFNQFSDFLYTLNGKYPGIHHALMIDPRTTRYGLYMTVGDQQTGGTSVGRTTENRKYGDSYTAPPTWTTPNAQQPEQFLSNAPGGLTVTKDRDGIRRPADDGSPFTDPTQGPEILNRPFQSVADMGYAFRDVPWTTINLFGDPQDSTNSGDGALLDLFSMTESSQHAGVINPNTASETVLQTLLSNASIREGNSPLTLSPPKAKAYAKEIRSNLGDKPMLNPGEIAALAAQITTKISISGYQSHKDRQVIARALADVSNVRTWNFLIDVIAQSGKLAAGASGLESFVSQGERRMWYQVSLDRITGEILTIQKESVFE